PSPTSARCGWRVTAERARSPAPTSGGRCVTSCARGWDSWAGLGRCGPCRPGTTDADTAPRGPRISLMNDVYDLFSRGTELLEAGHHHQAVIPLTRARDLAPEQTSIREALGRSLFHIQRYEQAADELQ